VSSHLKTTKKEKGTGFPLKMMLNKINGKMYNVIINMYDSIKSCISYNNCISEYVDCANGVRQGENLSPLHTLSKAFSKSVKAQNNFLFLSFIIWKNEKRVKMLSIVE
jgi:hypothetical protein